MTDDGSGAFKAFEAEGWGERAQSYQQLTGRITARVGEELIARVSPQPGAKVLDVGTGLGDLAGAAAERGAACVGVDLSDGMLAAARERHPGVDFLRADVEALPFEDCSFDVVLAGFVVNHVPNPERTLSEMARVLATEGRTAISVWDWPERMRLFGLLNEALVEAGVDPDDAGLPAGPSPYRFADPRTLRRLLRDAGLAKVKLGTVSFAVEVADARELWDGLLGGSVRGSAAVLAQPDAARRRIRAALKRRAAEFRRPDGRLAVPVQARVAAATRG